MRKRFPISRPVFVVVALLTVFIGATGFLLSRTAAHADNSDPAHYDNIAGYTITGAGNTWINNSPQGYKHVQTYIAQAVVDSSGCVHTKSEWDEGGNNWGVYCNGDVQMHDASNAPSPVDNTNVTINGDTWSINNGGVQDSNGVQVPGISKATALGVDLPHNYLMVGDDGVGQHVVKFYDVSGSPNLVRSFGTPGGIRAGIPGEVTPTKFWGITGVGTDSAGNIYVAGSQQAAYIRSFSPDGNTLRWQLYGLHFSHACDFDRSSDGTWLYCGLVVYQMDYSKPVDQQWQLKYYTMDLDTYPNDARNRSENSVWYRVINGQRYLFDTDMNNLGGIYIFKQETGNSYIFQPAGQVSADDLAGYEGTFDVGLNSNTIYKAGCDAIYYKQLQGVDSNGNPVYGSTQKWSTPGPFNCAWKSSYDESKDFMVLGGGTPDNPINGWGEGGPVVAGYSHWSDPNQRHLDWQITVPFRENVQGQDNLFPINYTNAGGYLFISYVNRDGDYAELDGEAGATRVYRMSDGSYVGRMLPDGPGGVQGSWIDIMSGAVKAMQRSDGTILIMREENWLSKQIIYMWNPGGGTPPPPTPTPTPVPTILPTATPTPMPTSTPIAGGSLVTAINAGGNASGNFVADSDYDQGNQYSDTSSSIDTSQVSNPAPQDVYQSCRWNPSFTYTIPNLTPGASYRVQLDWAELTFSSAQQRQFNVAINGNQVLNNFDVYATAGYKVALSRSFTTTADSNGTITIAFSQGAADNPFVSGIEIYTT